jgi:hypothetical protein
LNAQGDKAEKQLNDCNKSRGVTGFFGSPFVLAGTQMHEGIGFLFGANGAIIFNDAFFTGMAFNFLLPAGRVNCPMPDHEGRHRLSGVYGGFFFGHPLFSIHSLRVTGDMLVGLGSMTWGRSQDRPDRDSDDNIIRGTGFRHPWAPVFMVLEPRIVIELFGNEEASLFLGISYRHCPFFRLQYEGVDVVPRTAFNGFSISLMFTINYGSSR